MIRQYHAQRRRGGPNPLGVGVIPAGAIFYIQDDGWWRDRYRGAPICRNPWIVEAFLNGTIGAARRNRQTGLWENIYAAGRSDMALVRSLRDGRRRQVAVRTLILHEEHGRSAGPCPYPDLPDMRLWRLSDPRGHRLNHRSGPGGSSENPASPSPSDRFPKSNKSKEQRGDEQRGEWREGESRDGCRIAVRRRKGASLRSRAVHALAPSGRDAARRRGLPEEQGG